MFKRAIKFILIFVFMISSVCVNAFAANAIDLGQKGSVTVSVTDRSSGNIINGGTFTVYYVASVEDKNGALIYEYTDAFSGCRISLEELDSVDLASSLVSFAYDNSVSGTQVKVSDGEAILTELELGLYLIVQTIPADGYYSALPFLVSVPMTSADGTEWIYDVSASPKVSSLPKPTPEDEEKLIQTGQLEWPIPVLACVGLGFVAAGWWLVFIKREKHA